MLKTSLAKTVDPNEAPGVTQLRARVAQIVQDEFGGDLCSGIWLAAARRAAERVVEAVVRDWKMPHSGAPEARAGSAPGKPFTGNAPSAAQARRAC